MRLFLTVWFVLISGMAQADILCSNLPTVHYQAGVDVHGRDVIPADLPGVSAPLPEPVRIPMTIDLAQNLGVVLPVGADMPANFGEFAVFADGRVTYQGRDLTSNAEAYCHNRSITQDGQASPAPDDAGVVETRPDAMDTIFTGEFE